MDKKDILSEIQNIVEQIIQKYKPSRIILFGPAGRGEYDKVNDLDFLIIFEIRNNIKIQMFKIQNTPTLSCSRQRPLGFEHWDFGHSNLFRISIFEFRIFLLPSCLVGLRRSFASILLLIAEC